MLPSVFALSVPNKSRQPTRHNIACGLLDILACKHCRRARKSLIPTCCKTSTNNNNNAQKDKQAATKVTQQKSTDSKQKKHKLSAADIDNRNFLTVGPAFDLESLTAGPRSSRLLPSRRHSLSTSNLPDAVTIGAYSILKTSPLCQQRIREVSDNLKKQARFSESVSVIVHDLDNQKVIKDEIRLKESPQQQSDGKKSRGIRDLDPKKMYEKPFELDSMEVEYVSGEAFLKVKVFIGAEFMQEKVEIHSARHGQCLVIVGYKPEPLGDGTNYFRRYMQKFRLINPVDPYAIKASVLSRGMVKIMAPLVNWDEDK